MANPLSPALARTDYVLGKLRQARMLDAVRAVAATKDGTYGGKLAREVLLAPTPFDKVDQLLGDNGLTLGKYLGSGVESLVWEANPQTGVEPHVIKVRRGGSEEDFEFPEGVEGLAPYWATTSDKDVYAALQPRAAAVFRPAPGMEKVFRDATGRVYASLQARGWNWTDRNLGNIGVMPDGRWAAIDGFLDKTDLPARVEGVGLTPEEAIRMLRLTPEEEATVYGAGQ